MSSPRLLLNRIQTPDGTVLTSRHIHDYQEYVDENGFTYMVDGGLIYSRRNVHEDAPYKELSVWSSDSFEKIRNSFEWGTRGKNGRDKMSYVVLKNLSSDHIIAILTTQTQVPVEIREIFHRELAHRKEEKDE